ncbi:MAG: hypothetical protein GHCLOJNM_03813 [bacterium]|nr:hypothetical protein [bacterium]
MDDLAARREQARALARGGNHREALALFDRILSDSPSDVESLFMRGGCHYKLGSLDQARADFLKVRELAPNHPHLDKYLAQVTPAAPAADPLFSGETVTPGAEAAPTRSRRKAPPKNLYRAIAAVAALGLAALGFDMVSNPNSYPFLRKEMVSFEWEWKAGEVSKYRLNLSGEGKVEMAMAAPPGGPSAPPGGPPPMSGNARGSAVFRETVKEVDAEGTATLELAVESYEFQFNGPPPMQTSFSSTAAAPGAPDLSTKPLTVRVDKHGQVREVKGMEALLEDIAKDTPPGAPPGGLGSELKQEDLRKLLEPLYGGLPTAPVAVDGSWETATEQPIPGFGKVSTRTTSGVGPSENVGGVDCLQIVSSSEHHLTLAPSGPGAGPMPIPKDLKLNVEKSQGTGKLLFSKDPGHLLSNTQDYDLSFSTELDMAAMMGGGAPPPGMPALPKMNLKASVRIQSKLERL